MSLFESLFLTPKSKIGGIEIVANLEEIHTDTLQATEHPVEKGAPITDHAYLRPREVLLRCGWSNSSFSIMKKAVTAFFEGGEMSNSDYVASIYSQLLALQESRAPFDIVTSRRKYSNMLITSLAVTTEQQTSNMMMLTATCREIIIVSTRATTLPPKEQQANPASTAAVENAGTKSATPAPTPAPGGSAAPGAW